NQTPVYVIIEVTIGTDSMMYNPKTVYSSGTRYSENAITALEQLSLRFVPAKKNGKNVPSTLLIPIRFDNRKRSSNY
ncbi:MAG: energy transducer TonB, partial [Bacteroidia bacterium]|nr:energy transducer TonB [Bacteroidia bacterium]